MIQSDPNTAQMSLVISQDTTACFTGHRPKHIENGYDELSATVLSIKSQLRSAIEDAISEGYNTFISGGALGVDQWAAECVLSYPGIRLIIALPLARVNPRWPEHAVVRLAQLIKRIPPHDVVVVSNGPYHPGVMTKRNIWMVNKSSKLIAVYSGVPGGTDKCIKYAKSSGGIRIVVIKP